MGMQYNINNIPLDKLLVFNKGEYIIKRKMGTKDSNKGNRVEEIATIIELDSNTEDIKLIHGYVVGIPGNTDNKRFRVVDLSENEHIFTINDSLREPNASEWYELSRRIPGLSMISSANNLDKGHGKGLNS